jgi:hypothetical protein
MNYDVIGDVHGQFESWNDSCMDQLRPFLGQEQTLADELIGWGSQKGHWAFAAIEALCKGLEVELPIGAWFHDKGDDTYRSLLHLGPAGIGYPVWIWLVLAYLAVVLSAVALNQWLDFDSQVPNRIAGSGPALLGLIDLLRRLRTVAYRIDTPLGLGVTIPASVLDRLTFRECGWYLPILGVPLPLWLLGYAVTAILLTS